MEGRYSRGFEGYEELGRPAPAPAAAGSIADARAVIPAPLGNQLPQEQQEQQQQRQELNAARAQRCGLAEYEPPVVEALPLARQDMGVGQDRPRPRQGWSRKFRQLLPGWLRGWRAVAVGLALLLIVPKLLATIAGVAVALLMRAASAAMWHFSFHVGGEMVTLAREAVSSIWALEEVVVLYLTGQQHQQTQPTYHARIDGAPAGDFPPEPAQAQQTYWQYMRTMMVGAELSSFFWVAILLRTRHPRAGGAGG